MNLTKRPRLGLMKNDLEQVTLIRAWSYHAGLKYAVRVDDYDFDSISILTAHPERVPRVAMMPCKYA